MIVNILATCRRSELIPATLLVFKTLRVGFPTATIMVTVNQPMNLEVRALLGVVMEDAKVNHVHDLLWPITHHEWLSKLISDSEDPAFVLDTDIIFWGSMEEFRFGGIPLAGRFSPQFCCQFANAVTRTRLHTSLLWIDPVKVKEGVKKYGSKFPDCYATPRPTIEDLVYPRYMPNLGQMPYFSDTCSLLYNAIGGYRFTEDHLNRYDHVGSATLSDLVAPCYPEYRMRETHFAIFENPQLARGSWKIQDEFYAKHAC